MNYISADSRGIANHGWLEARHYFSFGTWYHPERIQFGALRVVNDDRVAPGMGFATHPHDNMEIITFPWTGTLRHKDSLGIEGNIQAGEVQIMSAGSGITHSEFNPSHRENLTLFQIWIFPNQREVEPRYQQFRYEAGRNAFKLLIGPQNAQAPGWIHQEAYLSLADLDEATHLAYQLHSPDNGVFFIQVSGESSIEGQKLAARDALELTKKSDIRIDSLKGGRLLTIEVPIQHT